MCQGYRVGHHHCNQIGRGLKGTSPYPSLGCPITPGGLGRYWTIPCSGSPLSRKLRLNPPSKVQQKYSITTSFSRSYSNPIQFRRNHKGLTYLSFTYCHRVHLNT